MNENPRNAINMQSIRERWFWILLFFASFLGMLYQAFTMAPASDEVAHLISGIAIVQTGDPGFYRVNPPLHKVFSGAIVDAAFAPYLRHLYPASDMTVGSRAEFRMSEKVISDYPNDYKSFFVAGRLPRILIILCSALVLLMGLPESLRSPARVATCLFLTSPMTLGHGWVIMPDAFSGLRYRFF